MIEERDDLGTLQAHLTWGQGLISQVRSGARSFYHADGHGSVRALSDGSQVVTDTYDYDAYGGLLSQTGSAVSSHRYAGEQFVEGLGGYYLRARYYEPGKGRFLTRDEFEGFPRRAASLNKYLYADANPLVGLDPTGRFTIKELAVSSAIGGVLNAALGFESGQTISTVATNFAQGAVEGAAFYGIGSGAVRLLKFAHRARLAGSISRFLERISLAGPAAPGFTHIANEMTIRTVWGKIALSSGSGGAPISGALRHIVDDLLRKGGTGSAAARTQLAEILALKELEAALNIALAAGVSPNTPIVVRTAFAKWELIFRLGVDDAGRQVLTLFHALPRII